MKLTENQVRMKRTQKDYTMSFKLSVVKEVESGKISINAALKMALKNRNYTESLIHHSDRGLQYCSDIYQKQLSKNKIKVSMTEKYDPYANAIAERVNGILKQEFLIEEYKCSMEILNKVIAESIYVYNNRRPHTSCYMLTPEQMHQQRELRKPTYCKKAKSARGLQPSC